MKNKKQCPVKWFVCFVMVLVCGAIQAWAEWPRMASSKDGTPISYEVWGEGEPALVFIHGWSCDARYWREQVPVFSKTHRVVVLDLAGHGHSGQGRARYTMENFGEDVKAVTEAAGIQQAILIGHSMGGSVIVEAARLTPERVVGLIGVDTLENVEFPLTREEFTKMVAPLERDFRAGAREFIGQMFFPETDPQLREWILSDMTAAPSAVALSAMKEMMELFITGEAARVAEKVQAPVVSVNGSLWPINYEANRRHLASYDAIVIDKADHFLMMDRPEEFNRALEKAISMIVEKPVPEKNPAE